MSAVELFSGLLSRMHIDLALTNASRVPRSGRGRPSAARSFGRTRVCVDNYLESAVTGRQVQLRQKTIRDRVEEKESAARGEAPRCRIL